MNESSEQSIRKHYDHLAAGYAHYDYRALDHKPFFTGKLLNRWPANSGSLAKGATRPVIPGTSLVTWQMRARPFSV